MLKIIPDCEAVDKVEVVETPGWLFAVTGHLTPFLVLLKTKPWCIVLIIVQLMRLFFIVLSLFLEKPYTIYHYYSFLFIASSKYICFLLAYSICSSWKNNLTRSAIKNALSYIRPLEFAIKIKNNRTTWML